MVLTTNLTVSLIFLPLLTKTFFRGQSLEHVQYGAGETQVRLPHQEERAVRVQTLCSLHFRSGKYRNSQAIWEPFKNDVNKCRT